LPRLPNGDLILVDRLNLHPGGRSGRDERPNEEPLPPWLSPYRTHAFGAGVCLATLFDALEAALATRAPWPAPERRSDRVAARGS
jgi:hypothetical protein